MPIITTTPKMQSSMFGRATAFSVLQVTSELNFQILFKEALKAAINPQGNKEFELVTLLSCLHTPSLPVAETASCLPHIPPPLHLSRLISIQLKYYISVPLLQPGWPCI